MDKILAIGFNVPATGFTRVMREILGGVADRYDCHWIGIGYKGPVVEDGFTAYPCNLNGGDVYGADQARELIEEIRPRLVFLLNDFWHLKNYRRVLSAVRDEVKVVAYTPVDGGIGDESLVAPLDFLDCLVTYTEFGRREIESAVEGLRRATPRFGFGRVAVVPHGVDVLTFGPWPRSAETVESCSNGRRRLEAKRRIFSRQLGDLRESDIADSFIVLNANRPNRRKRVDLTIEAFALFARGKPENVRLCLHHAIMSEQERQETLAHAKRCGISERLMLGGVASEAGRLSDEGLNRLYNACDVGINTATGEGWGLVSFEHGATGAAQIVPRHSALTELWEDSAELLEPVEVEVPPYSRLMHAEVSAEDAAAALERLYSDPGYLEEMSLAAYRNAHRPEYRWHAIADTWDRLLGEVLGEELRSEPA